LSATGTPLKDGQGVMCGGVVVLIHLELLEFSRQATVYATLSTMWGFGDYLVRQGLWKINLLRWMIGPKVTPYSRLPKRIDHSHMKAMWREAANRHSEYTFHLWVTVSGPET
jgi:site-specific recombinase XerC